jgi:hypothetical protein
MTGKLTAAAVLVALATTARGENAASCPGPLRDAIYQPIADKAVYIVLASSMAQITTKKAIGSKQLRMEGSVAYDEVFLLSSAAHHRFMISFLQDISDQVIPGFLNNMLSAFRLDDPQRAPISAIAQRYYKGRSAEQLVSCFPGIDKIRNEVDKTLQEENTRQKEIEIAALQLDRK